MSSGWQVADVVREQGGGDAMGPFFSFLTCVEPVLHLLPPSGAVVVVEGLAGVMGAYTFLAETHPAYVPIMV